tara:strand:- start:11723 stop:11938 length:216 start_codon:yes stop_codon:yes gene_type:complete
MQTLMALSISPIIKRLKIIWIDHQLTASSRVVDVIKQQRDNDRYIEMLEHKKQVELMSKRNLIVGRVWEAR